MSDILKKSRLNWKLKVSNTKKMIRVLLSSVIYTVSVPAVVISWYVEPQFLEWGTDPPLCKYISSLVPTFQSKVTPLSGPYRIKSSSSRSSCLYLKHVCFFVMLTILLKSIGRTDTAEKVLRIPVPILMQTKIAIINTFLAVLFI